jgi:hypothetical protein
MYGTGWTFGCDVPRHPAMASAARRKDNKSEKQRNIMVIICLISG